MYSLTIVIISAVVCLFAGLGLGLLFGRRSSADSKKFREAERKLDQVIQDKRAYEDEVVDHFSKTAKLLNSLTDSYREVHNHLATGAATLCQGQGPIAMDRLQRAGDAEIPAHLANIRPPLDYAPKSSPEEKGMLAEEFGLERHRPRREAIGETEKNMDAADEKPDAEPPTDADDADSHPEDGAVDKPDNRAEDETAGDKR